MSRKSIFVTYCLKNLMEPKVFKIRGWAEKRSIANDLNILQFKEESKAERFYEQKKKQFKLNNLQNMQKLLSTSFQFKQLPLASQNVNMPQGSPSQSSLEPPPIKDTIDSSQRQKRQNQIKEIMQRYIFFKEPKFVSTILEIKDDHFYEGYFDGVSKNNPGMSAIGFLIKNDQGKTLFKKGQFIGLHRTNNQAQMLALYFLMSQAYCNGIKRLKVYGDSLLAINYMNKKFKCKSANLSNLLLGNIEVSQKIDEIQFHHINRSYNHQADSIANSTLKNLMKKKN